MYLVPKTNLYDATIKTRVIFTKGDKYYIDDIYNDGKESYYITDDNQHFRNYISMTGSYINNFLIG